MQCHESTDGRNREYEYIKVTWGTKIAKILVFPPNQSDGKEMFRSQLGMIVLTTPCHDQSCQSQSSKQ